MHLVVVKTAEKQARGMLLRTRFGAIWRRSWSSRRRNRVWRYRIVELNAEIGSLEKELHVCARRDEDAARPMTDPGVGPVTAMALQAFAPPMESFRRGRDFAA